MRSRSWAIHNGILDDPWEGPKMCRTVGAHAGVCTFTGEAYGFRRRGALRSGAQGTSIPDLD